MCNRVISIVPDNTVSTGVIGGLSGYGFRLLIGKF